MRTFRHVVDRINRDFLTPADEQPTRTKLNANITKDSSSLVYQSGFISPEEVEFLGPGVIIEIGREQIVIGAVNETSNTLSNLIRGANGTLAYSHDAGEEIIVAPTTSRLTVFEALCDSVVSLYPDLYRISVQGPLSGKPARLEPETIDVTGVFTRTSNGIEQVYFNYHQFDPVNDGPVVYADTNKPFYATTTTSFPYPERETETLDKYGIDPSWEQILIAGTLLYLIGKPDFASLDIESISEAVDAQVFPPGRGSDLRASLIGYYQYLMDRARRVQRNHHAREPIVYRGF